MKDFREEILRRRNAQRTRRSSSWLGIIAKILLLAFVIVMIRFFGKPFSRIKAIKPDTNLNSNIETIE